ncbi:DNA repair and recombination protein Rad22 [Entamoeba marina]
MTLTTTTESFGTKIFEDSKEIGNLLEQKIPTNLIATRPGPGQMKLVYLESWRVVELSNALFGFDGWSCCITNMNVDFIDVEKGKFKVGVTAIVRVTLKNGVYHEDVGVGMSDNPRKGAAIELAKKEAVSDGRKRALRLFGNYLGNSLYDRDYVRQMDTNHKINDISPVTYDAIRSKEDTCLRRYNENYSKQQTSVITSDKSSPNTKKPSIQKQQSMCITTTSQTTVISQVYKEEYKEKEEEIDDELKDIIDAL